MKPITFTCEATLLLAPEDIARHILDLTKWPDFRGYGPIPGIKSAEFDIRTPDVVGTRIRVTNLDGSSHIEQVVHWQPERRLSLEFKEFSAPLSKLASTFEETWEFQRVGNETKVARSFRLYPRSLLGWLALRMVAFFLKRAVRRNLLEMQSMVRVAAP